MNVRQLEIVQHSLGVDQYGQGVKYRNDYVAGPDDAVICRELVAMGFMVEHRASQVSGGDPWFHVTPEGIAAMYAESPRPPKLTLSQKRYREWLDVSDICDISFGDWLKQRGKA